METYRASLDQVTAGGLSDLEAAVNAVFYEENPLFRQDALMEVVPELGVRSAGAAGLVSASFFDEVMAYQGQDVSAFVPDAERRAWLALTGWVLSHPEASVVGALAAGYAFNLLAGGFTRLVSKSASDTIMSNSATVGARVQRVPAPGCCAFCAMLASRGAVYRSEESAGTVVGRGTPVSKNLYVGANGVQRRTPGGAAKGIGKRYTRDLGAQFHDHCKCRVVPLTRGNSAQLEAIEGDYFEAYTDAAREIQAGKKLVSTTTKSADGSLKTKSSWVDAKGSPMSTEKTTRMILAKMRQDLGVR